MYIYLRNCNIEKNLFLDKNSTSGQSIKLAFIHKKRICICSFDLMDGIHILKELERNV